MQEVVDDSAGHPRLRTSLLSLFAALALILGSIGVYGVVAYSVARRTPELAIRMALGASPQQMLREAARSGLLLCIAGLAAGLTCAVLLSRTLASLLYQVQPGDPATFVATAAGLLAVAILACWLPARRATRIDPAAALRSE